MMIVCDEALKHLGMSPRAAPASSIQGFGNVGSNAARLMRRRGYKIDRRSPSRWRYYNPDGIDIEALSEYHQRNGTHAGIPRRRAARSAGTAGR